MRIKVYFGKVCAKHPELKGERFTSNYMCVECLRLQNRDRYHEDPKVNYDRSRKWCEENSERNRARKRKWYEENKEHALTLMRAWRKTNKEYDAARHRNWDERFKAKHGFSYRTYLNRLEKER